MEGIIESEVYKLLKEISMKSYIDNIGFDILFEANRLIDKIDNERLNKLPENHLPILIQHKYVMNENSEDDFKYEGLKEIKTVELIGQEMLRTGCISKYSKKSGNNVEVYLTALVYRKTTN